MVQGSKCRYAQCGRAFPTVTNQSGNVLCSARRCHVSNFTRILVLYCLPCDRGYFLGLLLSAMLRGGCTYLYLVLKNDPYQKDLRRKRGQGWKRTTKLCTTITTRRKLTRSSSNTYAALTTARSRASGSFTLPLHPCLLAPAPAPTSHSSSDIPGRSDKRLWIVDIDTMMDVSVEQTCLEFMCDVGTIVIHCEPSNADASMVQAERENLIRVCDENQERSCHV